jgi:hypothetical protein
MWQSGQTAKNRASVKHTAMARRMRSIANNRGKTPAASLTDEAKGAAGLGKQQKTATPRRDRKFVIQILHKIVMWMGAVT